ncbi:glycosyltransferase [Pseudonocardia spinosispora]|uniref:glycosyltransferase n=1 Tax=Pseudonocardia spinosispora TaxID=103441 RepID=UPI0004902428|nr:glycosyltransferase [Pseudonocardia spinosispora]
MRVLCAALPSPGHAYPLLPLAVAAVHAGHKVNFVTDESFLSTVRGAGLTATPAGMSIPAAFEAARRGGVWRPGTLSREELAQVVGTVFGDTLVRAIVADLVPLLETDRPDLVIYGMGATGAAMAAQLAEVPAVCHTFGRYSTDPPFDSIYRTLTATAAQLGVRNAELPSFGDPVIDICPDSAQNAGFVTAVRRTALRPVGWSPPGSSLPDGVATSDRGRPLVYLTLGTAMGTVEVLREAIAGLAPLDVDVLVATGPSITADDLGVVPGNVRVEQWVAQSRLLEHVDLVVHHGGSGTTLGAFGAGVPQLMLPQGADQFSNTELVAALGVGAGLLDEHAHASAISTLARHLLADPAVAAAAGRLAAEVARMASPAEVAALLPTFI